MIDTWSSLASNEIADISIATAGVKLNLSKAMSCLRSMVLSLEVPLAQFAENKEHYGSDVIMSVSLTPLQEDNGQNTSSSGEDRASEPA